MGRKGRESVSRTDDGAQVLRPRPAGGHCPVRGAALAGDLGGGWCPQSGRGSKAGVGSRREEGAADTLPGAQTGGEEGSS